MSNQFIHSLTLLAVAGWAFVACTSQPLPGDDPDTIDGMVLSAGLAVKTNISGPDANNVYETHWQTGDKISVNGTLSSPLSSEYNDSKEAEFTISGSLTAPFKVLYPGTTSTNVVSIPASQTYLAGTFPAGSAPTYGTATKSGDKYSVQLHNFCGILRFALNGSATLSKIVLNSLGEESISGDFRLTAASGGFTGQFGEDGNNSGTITLSFGSGLALSGSDTYIYMPLPAQTYASGLEALIYQADGAFMRLKFSKFRGDSNTLAGTDVIEFESKTFVAGRSEDVFSISNLTAENGGEPTTEAPGVTVAVYNIKQQDNRLGDTYSDYISMERSDVKSCMGATIAALGADIIGFNEFDSDYLPNGRYDIKAMAEAHNMYDYEWHLNYPNDVDRSGTWLTGYSYSTSLDYANGFAFNTNTLTLEDNGYVWISNTENDYWSTPEKAYENSAGRHTVVWAKFKHKKSGKRFYFFVTHFATYINQSASDQEKNTFNTQSLETYAKKKVNGSLPIIVVGDLNYGSLENDSPHDPVANYATLTSYWTDVWAKLNTDGKLTSFYQKYDGTLSGSSHKYYYPWTTYAKNKPWRRLDYILTKNGNSQNITPMSYKTVRLTYTPEDDNPRCPSDHLPIVSFIAFE